jgi:hypothetical protein
MASEPFGIQQMAALDVSTWRGMSLQRMLTWLDGNPIREGADRLVRWFADRCIPCIGTVPPYRHNPLPKPIFMELVL